jgi:hypothetical protein
VLFFGYPGYSLVDDVNYKNVCERNWRDGRCIVDNVDRDGSVVEYDYDCYYQGIALAPKGSEGRTGPGLLRPGPYRSLEISLP